MRWQVPRVADVTLFPLTRELIGALCRRGVLSRADGHGLGMRVDVIHPLRRTRWIEVDGRGAVRVMDAGEGGAGLERWRARALLDEASLEGACDELAAELGPPWK